MKNTIRTVSTALFLAASAASLAGQADINRIGQAVNKLDSQTIQNELPLLQDYDFAYANYQLAVLAHLNKDEETALSSLDAAIEKLVKLNEREANNAEVLALLAQVYGYKAGLQPFKAAYYGMKSNSLMDEAKKIAPNNPRVLLVSGIIAANTPAIFGGSNEQALEAFTRAIEVYASDTHSEYHWGYPDAYTWRGIIHRKLGDIDLARVDWESALAIQPDFGWAISLLQQQ